jgi:hypothetical protein
VLGRGRSFDRYRAGVKYVRDFANSSVGEPDAAFGSGERCLRTEERIEPLLGCHEVGTNLNHYPRTDKHKANVYI